MRKRKKQHFVQNVRVDSTIRTQNKLPVVLLKGVTTFLERLRKSFVPLENLDLEMLRFVLIVRAERFKSMQGRQVAQIVQ